MGKVLGRTLFAVTICAVMFNRSQLSWKMACRHYFCLREKYNLAILFDEKTAGSADSTPFVCFRSSHFVCIGGSFFRLWLSYGD